jgi:copper chaperone CopZ
MAVESIEYHLPGIKNIRASYHSQTLEVEFDDNLLTEQAILDALKKKHYTAIPIQSEN